ncbi:threonine/serine dehydratase [Bradyrhizobium sp. AUGA SZCCT0177]|uniref:threonine/serine dehydratase n=1 Tax=Bradyrhizobium sp. AUGA SZCCT0177 TaxID=2807665 RepID=UPI001BA7C2BC|nr:threonine/serine dehydratase [Bradyrhizobium sp. AUGA SZCCT0177]MBR1284025.1 threonine/serine dehydratase [Bradyrhizobium sp. AUGA SZCCT0177]
MDGLGEAVTPQAIAACEKIIRPYIRRTPVIETDGREFGLSAATICLKLELLQHSGAFKARGAFTNLLTRAIPKAGVVAASGGNHGAAVAYAAMRLGIPAKIFVPSVSSPAKIKRIREYGADLTIEGDGYADALAGSEAWAQQTGALPVHAFDQNETIMGQGTIGLELDEQLPTIDTVLVAVGGGGLVAGIAAWYAGRIKVIGVEPFASPTLTRALEAGHPVDAEAGGLAADSLAPRRVGEIVFPIAQKYAPRTVLVTDDAIAEAQQTLWRTLRIVAEPGGAAAFSAILSGAYRPADGERVAVVVSGGNTAAVNFDITR